MKHIFSAFVVFGSFTCLARAQTNNTLVVSTITSPQTRSPQPETKNRHEKAREALLPLLRGVFHTKRQDSEVLLTVDAGWRNDSLSIEYKYYKGQNLLTLENRFLVEKIYFTMIPSEMNVLETETDEFLFLYLRNDHKFVTVNNFTITALPGDARQTESYTSSCGFPVRPENLALIIQYLKELREKS